MISNILKEELNQEKFKQFLYKKIVNNYYLHPIGIGGACLFKSKENDTTIGRGTLSVILIRYYGSNYKHLISEVINITITKAKEYIDDYSNHTYIDISGNEPKFIDE